MGIELPGDNPIQISASGTNAPSNDITVLESRRDFSDEKLRELIRKDGRYEHRNVTKLIRKLHIYFESVISSQGFECRCYPGPICDLTTVEPKLDIIDKMDYFMVASNRMYLLANLALECYNQNSGSELRVMRLLAINGMKGAGCSFTYYITFIAWNADSGDKHTLQAKVHDGIIDMEVIFCRRKEGQSSHMEE